MQQPLPSISTGAFSLYLNDLSASTGSILFGGIDTEKFTGTLSTLSLIPDYSKATTANPNGIVDYYGVILTSVSVTAQAGNTTSFPLSSTASDGSTVDAIGVVLDSGSVFSYLPTGAVQGIYGLLTAVTSPLSPYFIYVDCSLLTLQPSPTLNFQFNNSSGPLIKVGINEFVFPLSEYSPIANHITALGTLPFEDTCMFGLLSSETSGGATILGDTFLRSAYVVYDLENDLVAIAQTNFNSTSSNVVEFAEGSGTLPVVSGVARSATTSASKAGGVTSSTGKTETNSPSGTGSGAATSSSSKAAAVGSYPPPFDMGVLSVAGLFSLVGAGWFLA